MSYLEITLNKCTFFLFKDCIPSDFQVKIKIKKLHADEDFAGEKEKLYGEL